LAFELGPEQKVVVVLGFGSCTEPGW